MSTDRQLIACNYTEPTTVAAKGARAFVIAQFGGNMPERLRVVVRTRGGRWVEKWENTRRLGNFRLATIPPFTPRYHDDRLAHSDATPDMLAHVIAARAELG